jgi:hypothetical protein
MYYSSYYLDATESLTSEELRESIHTIVNEEICWLPNTSSDTRVWADVPDMMRITLCPCRRRAVMHRVVDFIIEICEIAPSDSETLCQRIQTEALRGDRSDTIAALVACSIYYGISHTLAYMILGSGEHRQTFAYKVLESTLETGDTRACQFLLVLHSSNITLPSPTECSAYIGTAVYDYDTHRETPSDPRTRNAYIRILLILWHMASHANLFTLLGNVSKQYVTGAGLDVPHRDRVADVELINLVFRILELRGILIPQDPTGYDRSRLISPDPNLDVLVDHPDAYYINAPRDDDTRSYLHNPRGYFRDMLEYACSSEQPSLLKRLLATPPVRFEGGRRPSLQDNNEIDCATGRGNVELVRVLLAADLDWKLGTDPHTGWFLDYIQGLVSHMKEETKDRYHHDDLDSILWLLTADQRNI